MISSNNILSHELIGLGASITKSTNRANLSICGKIIFETRNTITLMTETGKKQIAKKSAVEIKLQPPAAGACFISGSALIGRPEDRISRVMS